MDVQIGEWIQAPESGDLLCPVRIEGRPETAYAMLSKRDMVQNEGPRLEAVKQAKITNAVRTLRMTYGHPPSQ